MKSSHYDKLTPYLRGKVNSILHSFEGHRAYIHEDGVQIDDHYISYDLIAQISPAEAVSLIKNASLYKRRNP
jgi:hypothetical protein